MIKIELIIEFFVIGIVFIAFLELAPLLLPLIGISIVAIIIGAVIYYIFKAIIDTFF